jgi:hypothetical protein
MSPFPLAGRFTAPIGRDTDRSRTCTRDCYACPCPMDGSTPRPWFGARLRSRGMRSTCGVRSNRRGMTREVGSCRSAGSSRRHGLRIGRRLTIGRRPEVGQSAGDAGRQAVCLCKLVQKRALLSRPERSLHICLCLIRDCVEQRVLRSTLCFTHDIRLTQLRVDRLPTSGTDA